MAFAPPDPKKVEARNRALREAAQREIADIEAERRRIQQEIRTCYDEHTPEQIMFAGSKIQAHQRMTLLSACVANGERVWVNVGRSNGGRRKRNLYICQDVN